MLGIALILIQFFLGDAAAQSDTARATYAIVGADVLTMSEPALLRNHTVLIRGGRIDEIGPADSVRFDTAEVTEIAGPISVPGIPRISHFASRLPNGP